MKSRKSKSRVNSNDVARHAGVSQATVSRVLNRRENVLVETRQRVLDTICALGYRPNAIARSLVTQRTRSIGLVVSDILNPFYPELINALENVASAKQYDLILCLTNHGPDKERQLIDNLLRRKVDGIIFATAPLWSEAIKAPVEFGIPVVLTNRRLESYDTDYVVSDNASGAYKMTQHLLSLGHRHIAFVQGRVDASTNIERLKGYSQALKETGVSIDPDLVTTGNFTQAGGYRAAHELLRKRLPPTAIFCANDTMAFGVMEALGDAGFRVPKDISVAGFDDVLSASWRSIALTTVRQPIARMAKEAIMILLSRFEEDNSGERIHKVLQTEVVVRKTTATSRVRRSLVRACPNLVSKRERAPEDKRG